MKNLLVSAATSDLATALFHKAVAKEGMRLITTSRNKNIPDTVPSHRHYSGIDLTEETCLRRLADAADGFFSGPFCIAHFAGNYWKHKPLIHTDFNEIKELVTSHYLSLCGVARFLTPVLIKKGGGRLLAMSCNSVVYNYPDLSPFTAAKAAIESFIKSYANEYSAYSISATAIALPTMRTPKVLNDKKEGDHENYIHPDEFSDLILDQLMTQSQLLTGNTVRLIKHSSTFYHKGYFERNPRMNPIE